MISRRAFFACLCTLLFFSGLYSSSLYAKAESIPSEICKSISEQRAPSAYLFHKGQLWPINQPINLGELESAPNKEMTSSPGESYLILVPYKYTASASTSNTLSVELAELPPSCGKAKLYKLKWALFPKNIGAGRFEEQFDLYFDGPSSLGYPQVVKTMFNTTVIGFIHGSGSAIEISKEAAKDFFLGKRKSLIILVKNIGDRNLKLSNLTSDISGNPKDIGVKHTDCMKRAIEPASSCVVELERRSELLKSSTFVSYTFAFASNEVGSNSTEIHLEYDEKSGVRTFTKLWD